VIKQLGKTARARRYVLIVRWMAASYFAIGLVLSMVRRSGMVSDPQLLMVSENIFRFHEGLLRALVIAVGAWWSIAYTRLKGQTVSKFRKFSLASFLVVALVLVGILPLVLQFWDLLIVLMPFPNSMLLFHLRYLGAFHDHTFTEVYGQAGLRLVIVLYCAYQIVAYVGVLFWGRRWHCGMICLLHGNNAEAFGLGLPVIPHDKRHSQSKIMRPAARRVLRVL